MQRVKEWIVLRRAVWRLVARTGSKSAWQQEPNFSVLAVLPFASVYLAQMTAPQGLGPDPALDELVDRFADRRIVALTGAGCSTESGIPDYRGPGADAKRRPIQYGEFISDPGRRKRYWARSMLGWTRVAGAAPNPAHRALAAMEGSGRLAGIITQNVDGLHELAGSRRVLALHGLLSRVRCLDCGHVESRAALQHRLLDLNPGFRDVRGSVAPDGDADVTDERIDDFVVPDCDVCGGMFKPDVVFFGENVPKSRVHEAWSLYDEGDALLVVGSSLTVFSGYRFVLRAAKEGRPVAILNLGWTRGDEHAVVKLEGKVGTVLPELAARLRGAGISRGDG